MGAFSQLHQELGDQLGATNCGVCFLADRPQDRRKRRRRLAAECGVLSRIAGANRTRTPVGRLVMATLPASRRRPEARPNGSRLVGGRDGGARTMGEACVRQWRLRRAETEMTSCRPPGESTREPAEGPPVWRRRPELPYRFLAPRSVAAGLRPTTWPSSRTRPHRNGMLLRNDAFDRHRPSRHRTEHTRRKSPRRRRRYARAHWRRVASRRH